jgi:hypothetical protein
VTNLKKEGFDTVARWTVNRTENSNTNCSRMLRYVKDQVSHPYRTTGLIVVLYIIIFTFLDSRREEKRFWTEW